MYNFRVFHRFSKARMVVLVVKPWEVIKVHVSMCINMLDIVLSQYVHVLGPPRGFLSSEKNKISRKIRPFLMV